MGNYDELITIEKAARVLAISEAAAESLNRADWAKIVW